jgi:hypothetical protein
MTLNSNYLTNLFFEESFIVTKRFRKSFKRYNKAVIPSLNRQEREFIKDFKLKIGNNYDKNLYLYKNNLDTVLINTLLKFILIFLIIIALQIYEYLTCTETELSLLLIPVLILRFTYIYNNSKNSFYKNDLSYYSILKKIFKKHNKKVRFYYNMN